MDYTVDKTTNFRFQYNKLTLRMKRFVDEAEKIIKESPTDFQGKITVLGKKKEGRMFRFRMPGAYLHYILHEEAPIITFFSVTTLYEPPKELGIKKKKRTGGH